MSEGETSATTEPPVDSVPGAGTNPTTTVLEKTTRATDNEPLAGVQPMTDDVEVASSPPVEHQASGSGVNGELETTGGDSATSSPDCADRAAGALTGEMASAATETSGGRPLGPGPFSMDDFDTGVTLGTGSFGRVRIATHRETQTPWAIKILKKAEIIRMQQVCRKCILLPPVCAPVTQPTT